MKSKCDFCGKENTESYYRCGSVMLCSRKCYEGWYDQKNKKEREKEKDKQKHEEIKKMAEKIFVNWNAWHEPKVNPATAWENAEDFYNFAKEKDEEETNDE